jgi:hypothetical protein
MWLTFLGSVEFLGAVNRRSSLNSGATSLSSRSRKNNLGPTYLSTRLLEKRMQIVKCICNSYLYKIVFHSRHESPVKSILDQAEVGQGSSSLGSRNPPEPSPTSCGNLFFTSFPPQAPPQRHSIGNSGFLLRAIDPFLFVNFHDRLEAECADAIGTMLRSFATRSHCRSWQREFLRAFSSTTVDTSTLPLSGTRVLDLTRVLAGV